MGITTALNLQWVVCAPTQQTIMNKFLALACLATVATAAPEAEADPALLYNTYGYGLGAYNYGAYGLGAYGYAGYPYAAYHHAAPVATGYAHVSPSAALNIAGLANAAVPAVAGGYAAAGRYVANSAGVVHVAKREAEAEPEAEADADAFYTTYGYAGYPYAHHAYSAYAGYPYAHAYGAYPYNYGLGYAAYAAPAVAATVAAPAEVKTVAAPAAVATVAAPLAYHAAPLATGYAQVNHATSLSTAGLANAAVPAIAGGYAGAGRYVANSAGVVHVA